VGNVLFACYNYKESLGNISFLAVNSQFLLLYSNHYAKTLNLITFLISI